MARRIRPLFIAMLVIVLLLAGLMTATAQAECNTERCVKRVINQDRRDYIREHKDWLKRLRDCESTNRYDAVDPTGTYTGAYQFDDATWRSVGGEGRAMDAGKLEQDMRAVRLFYSDGLAPWPICGVGIR